MLKKLSVYFFISIVAMGVIGCAGQKITDNDQSWIREVEIRFTNDTTEFEREAFYKINNLEFVAEYDYELVRCRILSGETVKDFIKRLKSDPHVKWIKPFDEQNQDPDDTI